MPKTLESDLNRAVPPNIKKISRRILQGGVLSSLLWVLVQNDIPKHFERKSVKVGADADDVVTLASGNFLDLFICDLSVRYIRDLGGTYKVCQQI